MKLMCLELCQVSITYSITIYVMAKLFALLFTCFALLPQRLSKRREKTKDKISQIANDLNAALAFQHIEQRVALIKVKGTHYLQDLYVVTNTDVRLAFS